MHELAITESIVQAVLEQVPDQRISSIQLEIGTLSGVVPDSVRFCFELVAEGTSVAGARLEIDEPTGRASCSDCGQEFDTNDPVVICACGSVDVALSAGTELRIRSVEVV